MILSAKEIFIIQTAIDNILQEIIDEIDTRTGFTENEYKEIRNRLSLSARVSKEDLLAVNEALNEVCNGYRVENFDIVFDADINEVRGLLDRIHLSC